MSWKQESTRNRVYVAVADEDDAPDDLAAQNAMLEDQVAEVEGWYRLLQADHSALQSREARAGREAVELRRKVNGLEQANQELQHLVARQAAVNGQARGHVRGRTAMSIRDWARKVRQSRWAVAALVAIGTVAARESEVGSKAWNAVREAVGRHSAGAAGEDGFLRYAAMVRAREQAESARREYNERESSLKGDALLEAQDRLRAAKARDRQARLAFLPELARRCNEAGVPVPREAAEALVALKGEDRE